MEKLLYTINKPLYRFEELHYILFYDILLMALLFYYFLYNTLFNFLNFKVKIHRKFKSCLWNVIYNPDIIRAEIKYVKVACTSGLKERGGGQNFSTSFWMRFSQDHLCRYRFKFIFDDIIFLLSGNIIEYICFWRFNSIIMTWNKWLVFTKSVIMGLNNISTWPCPLGFVCLPCVITWLYSTPWLFMRSVGVLVCLSLRMTKIPGSRRTQYKVIFITVIVLDFLLSFFTQWLIYPFSFHIDILI